MKDQKRSYRRYKKQILLERRARKNYFWIVNPKEKSWAQYWEEIQSGSNTWMRTMSVPCSCFICSKHNKHKREDSGTLKNQIKNILSENDDGEPQDTGEAHLFC